jgi:hypothetical protein
VVFLSLIVGIGSSRGRLRAVLWVISITGFVVSVYAIAQAFDLEPFVPRALYTFSSPRGSIIRACSTLGHSVYLGNYLLYVAPLQLAFAFSSVGISRLFGATAAIVSLAAVSFTGTRGAWFGIAAGLLVFAVLEIRADRFAPPGPRRKQIIGGGTHTTIIPCG